MVVVYEYLLTIAPLLNEFFRVAFDPSGKIQALDVNVVVDGGFILGGGFDDLLAAIVFMDSGYVRGAISC